MKTVGSTASKAIIKETAFAIAIKEYKKEVRKVTRVFSGILEYSVNSCGPKFI